MHKVVLKTCFTISCNKRKGVPSFLLAKIRSIAVTLRSSIIKTKTMKTRIKSKFSGFLGKNSASDESVLQAGVKKPDLRWKDASKNEIKSKKLKGYEKYAF